MREGVVTPSSILVAVGDLWGVAGSGVSWVEEKNCPMESEKESQGGGAQRTWNIPEEGG